MILVDGEEKGQKNLCNVFMRKKLTMSVVRVWSVGCQGTAEGGKRTKNIVEKLLLLGAQDEREQTMKIRKERVCVYPLQTAACLIIIARSTVGARECFLEGQAWVA